MVVGVLWRWKDKAGGSSGGETGKVEGWYWCYSGGGWFWWEKGRRGGFVLGVLTELTKGWTGLRIGLGKRVGWYV